METKEMIKVIDELGTENEVEVVAFFTLKSSGKDYLIYTENKLDASGNVEVYTSEVLDKGNGSFDLKGVEDDSVWVEIKKVMLDIAKDGE